jgi:hypothetical protein
VTVNSALRFVTETNFFFLIIGLKTHRVDKMQFLSVNTGGACSDYCSVSL